MADYGASDFVALFAAFVARCFSLDAAICSGVLDTWAIRLLSRICACSSRLFASNVARLFAIRLSLASRRRGPRGALLPRCGLGLPVFIMRSLSMNPGGFGLPLVEDGLPLCEADKCSICSGESFFPVFQEDLPL